MFWKFNLMASHIDTLLDKEDVTLHELMDEDDVLQECKGQNTKLMAFLTRPEVIDEMVNLIIQEPDDSLDEKMKYKYPNTACELLTSDVPQMNDKLASDEAILAKVYGFLETEGPLNPLLASFFSKVMGLLITRKSEYMLEFLQSKDDFVGSLLHHLGTSAIMDLLLRLITCVESTEVRNEILEWLNEQKLIQKLVGLMDPQEDEDKHSNASQALCDIIRLSREQMSQLQEKADPDPLLATIESQETVADLLGHMLDGDKSESVITNGLAVIQTLIEFRKTGPEGFQEQMTALDAERLAQGVSNTLMAITPRLKDIHQLLITPPKQTYSAMPTTIGTLDPPLGNTRLQVARLVASLLLTNTHTINVELGNLGTINVLMDLFFKYCWNNFLHTEVERCISTILNNAPTENEGKTEHVLLNQLFLEHKLHQRIYEGFEENEQSQSRPLGHRRGYMGHLSKIANDLVDSLDKGPNTALTKETYKELPEETREKWETFVSGTLTQLNKKNTDELVGGHPLQSSSEDDDADFRDIPFPQDTAMQQAFSDYQLQQMTSNFIDQFGFNEEEFAEQEDRVDAPFNERISSIDFGVSANEENPNAAMFEQACSERIQQFDDNDSDEDLWEEKEITFSNSVENRPSPLVRSTGVSHGSDEESDSDSEDDLDSPKVVRQAQPVDAEKMDVDSNDAWPANFSDVPMDTAPAGWGDNQSRAENKPNEEGWADFSNANAAASSSQNDNENWADFSSFTNFGATNLNSSDPGVPRSSSPVDMDTAETNTDNSRPQQYLVQSAPADLHGAVNKKSEELKVEDIEENNDLENKVEQPVQPEQPSEPLPEPTTDASPNSSVNTSPVKDTVVEESSQPSAENTALPETNEVPSKLVNSQEHNQVEAESESVQREASMASEHAEDAGNQEEDEEDDLEDNFDFLATAGLMKSPGSSPSKATPVPEVHGNGPTTETTEKSEEEKLQEARAQALQALSAYDNRGSETGTANGPV